jgi:hypothetical protein
MMRRCFEAGESVGSLRLWRWNAEGLLEPPNPPVEVVKAHTVADRRRVVFPQGTPQLVDFLSHALLRPAELSAEFFHSADAGVESPGRTLEAAVHVVDASERIIELRLDLMQQSQHFGFRLSVAHGSPSFDCRKGEAYHTGGGSGRWRSIGIGDRRRLARPAFALESIRLGVKVNSSGVHFPLDVQRLGDLANAVGVGSPFSKIGRRGGR